VKKAQMRILLVENQAAFRDVVTSEFLGEHDGALPIGAPVDDCGGRRSEGLHIETAAWQARYAAELQGCPPMLFLWRLVTSASSGEAP